MTPSRHGSDSSVDSVDITAPESLQSELKLITDTVNRLKNFKPETTALSDARKARGRPKKSSPDEVLEVLDRICKLNIKIVSKLDLIEEENRALKEKITGTTTREASIVSATDTPPATVIGKDKIDSLDSRLDQIEQNSLSDVLKIDGESCGDIIESFSSSETKEYPALKLKVVELINGVEVGTIVPHEIVNVSIVGNLRKHLKVKLSSSSTRIKILKLFKNKKPDNLYTSDYLTRPRAKLLHDVRNLKKSHPDKISSAYVFNGNVCCKLVANNKIHYINNTASFQNFSENSLI